MSTDAEILGRGDVNDINAILAVTNTDVDEAIHAVKDNAEAIFTWDYEKGARPALNKLYEKAKHSQWNGETDLDWSIEVDQEAVVAANAAQNGFFEQNVDLTGTQMEHWDDDKWLEFGVHSNNWLLLAFSYSLLSAGRAPFS